MHAGSSLRPQHMRCAAPAHPLQPGSWARLGFAQRLRAHSSVRRKKNNGTTASASTALWVHCKMRNNVSIPP